MRSPPRRRTATPAFTLVELVTVIGIILILMTLGLPSIVSRLGSSNVNQAVSDYSGVLAAARAFAMANHTYVRVAMGTVPNTSPASVMILPIYSASGELDNDSTLGMQSSSLWPLVRPPLILSNAVFSDTLNGKTPDTSNDSRPSGSDIGALSGRNSPPSAQPVTFNAYIQFGPSGEARVVKAQLARFIASGVDAPGPQQGRNPFVLRLSGVNGTITIVRKENM